MIVTLVARCRSPSSWFCSDLCLNGIQEVTGSIPVSSTGFFWFWQPVGGGCQLVAVPLTSFPNHAPVQRPRRCRYPEVRSDRMRPLVGEPMILQTAMMLYFATLLAIPAVGGKAENKPSVQ